MSLLPDEGFGVRRSRRDIKARLTAETHQVLRNINPQSRRHSFRLTIRAFPVCTENLIRAADVMESPKLAE
jgi:hypothetical protein